VITLIAEFLFAVIFIRALLWYLQSRDPISRDLTIAFAGLTAMFVAEVVRRVAGPLPPAVAAVTLTLLLVQPYVTLRLAARLRKVPRWLEYAVLTASLGAAVPLAMASRPLSWPLVLLAVTVFVVAELIAATVLVLAAQHRTGAPRIRLRMGGVGTVLFAAAVVGLGAGAILTGEAQQAARTVSRVLALLSGIGYLIAFLPPRWLLRLWSSSAAGTVVQRLLSAPAADDGGQIWQRYAEVVLEVADADAVVILVRAPDNALRQAVSAGAPTVEVPGTWRDLDRLLLATQPVAVHRPDHGREIPLALSYAGQVGARYVTALPLQVTTAHAGALLLFNRHRSLFPADDRGLLAQMGTQVAVLAQRGDLLAEQRHLAEQLEATVAALTAASLAKSAFMANMSHELRTPLNAIIGFSELMRDEGVGATRTVPADWVDHVHSSGRHLLGLINDILDLAKVEAGRLDLHIEPIPLDVAVADVVTGLRPLIDVKALRTEIDVPPLVASVDPIRFRQILDNLLSNAIKFTPNGGRITISAVEYDGDVEVSVGDSGVGIDAADHERVFEEFQQVGDLSVRQAGTGLGLALTRRLVQAHGGSVTVVSALGSGSTFRVRMPAGVAEDAGTATDASVPGSGLGRILLIEDDVRAAELLRTYLNNAGYNVTVAGTGEVGLAAARQQRPDAIMLDVDLPGIDGWEVMGLIKGDALLADIPVFFATVLDERPAGLALGATEYFVKPIDHEVLLSTLARHVLPPTAGQPASVLVLEPDDEVRINVTEKLRADGIAVVACGDREEVRRLTLEHHFDLVICDVQMSDPDGMALLSALDVGPSGATIPVLALTRPRLDEFATGALPDLIAHLPAGEHVADSLAQWLAAGAKTPASQVPANPARVDSGARGRQRTEGRP